MKRVRFSVRYPGRSVHPLQRRIVGGSPITRAELLMWSPTADATALLWCDGDRAATETAVAGIDSLLACSFVDDDGGTYAFLRQETYELPPALLDLVADSRAIFLPPVVFHDTGAIEFEAAGEPAGLGALSEELSTLGDLTVERVRAFDRRRSPSRLTDRQRAALEAARSVGYYDVPREGSIADVAAELDCARSTAGELVRKAEAAVIDAHLDGR